MKSIRKFLYLSILPLVFLPLACGPLEKMLGRQPIEGKDGVSLRVRTGTPHIFALQDTNCDKKNALPDLGKIKVWLKDKRTNEVVLTEVDLTGVSGQGLSSDAIDTALYGTEIKEAVECVVKNGEVECKDLKQLHGTDFVRGKAINICRKGGAYDRESIENVALAMAAAVQPSWIFYKSLGHSSSDKNIFKKVTLLVHPLVQMKKSVSGDTELGSLDANVHNDMTDNAFWTELREQGMTVLAALPHSLERRAQFPVSFWEIPGVQSHEFGHHVFHSVAPDLAHSVGSPSMAILALNEGFADTFAHLVFESGKHPLAGIDLTSSRDLDRDVGSEVFTSGMKKSLTERVVSLAFPSLLNLSHGSYGETEGPNYSDPHILGAVVAYGLNGLLTQKSKITSDQSTVLEKNVGLDLLHWLEGMQTRFRSEEWYSNTRYLETALLNILQNSVKAVANDHAEKERMGLLGSGDISLQDHKDFVHRVFPVYAYRACSSVTHY